MAEISNPTPTTTTGDVFDKLFGTVVTLGSGYLTAQGQIQIAEANAKAQQRLADYHAVNPSLGPVNPAAAANEAGLSWVQRYLPSGSPITGAPGTGNQPAAVSNPMGMIVMVLAAVLVGLLIFRFALKK